MNSNLYDNYCLSVIRMYDVCMTVYYYIIYNNNYFFYFLSSGNVGV